MKKLGLYGIVSFCITYLLLSLCKKEIMIGECSQEIERRINNSK